MATDPDIDAAWKTMRATIRRTLQPFLPEASVDGRVDEIADWLNANGWKPPLRRIDPIIIAAGRAARDQAARKEPQWPAVAASSASTSRPKGEAT